MDHETVQEILERYENYFNYDEDYNNDTVECTIRGYELKLKKESSENYVTQVSIHDKTNEKDYTLYGLFDGKFLHTREYHRENNRRYSSVTHPYLSSIKLMYHVGTPYLLVTDKPGINLGEIQRANSFRKLILQDKLHIVSQTLEALDAIDVGKVQDYRITLDSINLVEPKEIFIKYSPKVYFINTIAAPILVPLEGTGERRYDVMDAFPKRKESNQIAQYIYQGGVILYKMVACKGSEYMLPNCDLDGYENRKELAYEIGESIKKVKPKCARLLTKMCRKSLYCHPKEEYHSLEQFIDDVKYARKHAQSFFGSFYKVVGERVQLLMGK